VLLGYISREPCSVYGLKKVFNASPASVYQPSPGALYPALRRLEGQGLLGTEEIVSSGRRAQRLYHATEAGRVMHLDWLRQPVDPPAVASDLGLHLMRFAMMENQLEPAEVLAFLTGLAEALEGFVAAMERYVASGVQSARRHAQLALEHGIAVHRASLDWTRSAIATLTEPSGGPLRTQAGTSRWPDAGLHCSGSAGHDAGFLATSRSTMPNLKRSTCSTRNPRSRTRASGRRRKCSPASGMVTRS
jgi:PadR family transcriptional regulator AphA